MIRTRFKKVLLVAPEIFPDQLLTKYSHIRHISAINTIFPSIFELNPDVIICDYDFMGKEMEKMLRRLMVNKFYHKIKICCYKSSPNEKTDSLLKVLGVDHFIYRDDLAKSLNNKTILKSVNSVIDNSILKWVAGIAN